MLDVGQGVSGAIQGSYIISGMRYLEGFQGSWYELKGTMFQISGDILKLL